MEKRCKNCNRLLFVEIGEIKQLKTNDKITYNFMGKIEIICKCGTKNNY